MADLRGAPPVPNSFNFMQFMGEFGNIVCWCPPESPRGNPGSATAKRNSLEEGFVEEDCRDFPLNHRRDYVFKFCIIFFLCSEIADDFQKINSTKYWVKKSGGVAMKGICPAVTRIRTWVVSATTRSTNHYTIAANLPPL